MRVVVVLAHPNRSSLNHAIADRAITSLHQNGHDVIFHDLYAENFDPILPANEMMSGDFVDPQIRNYGDEIANADGIVVVHPIWWGGMPAILKGWIDRVFRPGCVYAFEEVEGGIGVPVGMLKARKIAIFNTENTPLEMSEEMYGDPLDSIWKKNVFGVCGGRDVFRRVFHGVIMSEDLERKAWLAEVEDHINEFFPAAGMSQAA